MFGLAHPAGDVLEVVVGEPEPGPHRRGLREVEHLAGGGAAAGQREQLRGHAEQRVGLDERAVGQPHPQPVRGVRARAPRRRGRSPRRSAARRSRCPGTSPGCRAAPASGRRRAGRAAPRAARRSGGPGRGSCAPAPTGRRGAASGRAGERRSRRCRTAASRAGCRGDLSAADQQVFVGLRLGGQAALQLAQVAAEGGQQRVADLAVAGVVAAGDRAVHAGERSPQVVAGVRQPQVQVVVGGQRLEQLDLGAGQPGVTEQRQPLAAGRSVTPAAAQRFWRAGCAADRRRRGPAAPATAAAASRGRRRGRRRCRRRASRRAVAAAGRRRTRTGRRAGARRRSGGPAAARFSSPASKWPRWVASVRHHGSSRLSSITSSSGHTMASGDHGSSSTVPVISAISERGLRNATPAQTPSAPSPRPRMCDSRWLSHRSTPLRAGPRRAPRRTGRAAASDSSAPRPSASRSVRSARWSEAPSGVRLRRPCRRLRRRLNSSTTRPSSSTIQLSQPGSGRPPAARRSTRGGLAGSFG